ncbi:hypothetical protein ALC60_00638 [Trachymyrmex zeteki]|uniref:Uncharacterized protein n=1 Tax=Mycetomoellerius zeteki TaxID=64791 RepID=A0A151XJ35_9HYME|nr:hypothetical protein ALC60_00638 [Trachymyrmex zeteki]
MHVEECPGHTAHNRTHPIHPVIFESAHHHGAAQRTCRIHPRTRSRTYSDEMTDGDRHTDYKGRDSLVVRFSGIAYPANYQHQDQCKEELHAESLHWSDPFRKLHHATCDSTCALRHNVQNAPNNWYLRIKHYLPDNDETERDRRIDMTSGDVSYPLNCARYRQTEGQADGGNISGHHGTATEEVE